MNVAAHQKKEKNEKTCKRKAGEEKKHSTDLEEAGAAFLRSFRKQHGVIMFCIRRVHSVLGLSERPTAISTHSKQGR